MPSIKTLQDKYNKRIANQRRNQNNWSGRHGLRIVIQPPLEKGMKDFISYTMEGRAWKNKTRKSSKIKQCRNHI